jgi:uncharacterized membrane protein
MSIGKKVLIGVFALMFIGGGIAHFLNPEFYFQLMHYIIPPGDGELKEQLIYISGATEILAGLLFILPQTRRWGAIFIMLHLIAFLPIHVTMCFKTKPTPPWYAVWARLLIQFALIYWAAIFTQKPVNQTK